MGHHSNIQAIFDLVGGLRNGAGNLPTPDIFRNYLAPMCAWLFEATKKQAPKLEAKAQAVDFKELLFGPRQPQGSSWADQAAHIRPHIPVPETITHH